MPKAITIELEEVKKKAISAMEDCMASLTEKNTEWAWRYRGVASAWENILDEWADIDLESENEHYKEMLNIFRTAVKM